MESINIDEKGGTKPRVSHWFFHEKAWLFARCRNHTVWEQGSKQVGSTEFESLTLAWQSYCATEARIYSDNSRSVCSCIPRVL